MREKTFAPSSGVLAVSHRNVLRRVLPLLLLLSPVLSGCGDQEATAPRPLTVTSAAGDEDATTGTGEGDGVGPAIDASPASSTARVGPLLDGAFSFDRPLNEQAITGTFDPTLLSALSVEVCDPTSCAAGPVASYSASTGPGSETLRLDPTVPHFLVNWDTDAHQMGPGLVHRIRVLVAGLPLGHADVLLVGKGEGLKDASSGGELALRDGRTLPIKFQVTRNRVLVAWVMAAEGAAASLVADRLVTEFGSAVAEVVAILDFAGFAPADIAGTLRTDFGATASEADALLRGEGVVATAAASAGALLGGGYPLVEVIDVLITGYGLASDSIGTILFGLGLGADEAGTGLRQAAGLGLAEAASALRSGGYGASVVGTWLLGEPEAPDLTLVTSILAGVGYGVADVGSFLGDAGLSVPDTALTLLSAGFTISEVASWIVDGGGAASDEEAAAVLQAIGLFASDVGDWLVSRGASEAEAIRTLHDAGFPAAGVATWLLGRGHDLGQTVSRLLSAGYPVADVGDWLLGIFASDPDGGLSSSIAALGAAGLGIPELGAWARARSGGTDPQDALERTATALAGAGFPFDDIADWVVAEVGGVTDPDRLLAAFLALNAADPSNDPGVARYLVERAGVALVDLAGALHSAGRDPSRIVRTLSEIGGDAFEIAEAMVGAPGQTIAQIGTLLKDAGFDGAPVFDALYRTSREVLDDPVDFSLRVALAAMTGAGYFFDDFKTQLREGLYEWLYDALADAMIDPPSGLSMQEIGAFLVDVAGLTVDQVMQKAHDAGRRAEDVVAGLLASTTATAAKIAEKVQAVYALTEAQVAEVLARAGATADQIVEGMVEGVGATFETVASLLRANGFAPEAVFDALFRAASTLDGIVGDPVGFGLNLTLAVMQGAGYFLDSLTTHLRDGIFDGTFDWSREALADVLVDMPETFSIADITEFLIEIGAVTTHRMVELAEAKGFPVDEVIDGLFAAGVASQQIVDEVVATYGLTADQLAQAMLVAGRGAEEFASAMATTFSLSTDAALDILRRVGFSAKKVAVWLVRVLGKTQEGAAQALTAAGYTFEQVADWAFDTTKGGLKLTARILKATGASGAKIARWLVGTAGRGAREVFEALAFAGFTAGETASALVDEAGASLDQIATWLGDFYTLSLTETLDVLVDLGADLAELVDIGLNVLGATAELLTTALLSLSSVTFDLVDVTTAILANLAG